MSAVILVAAFLVGGCVHNGDESGPPVGHVIRMSQSSGASTVYGNGKVTLSVDNAARQTKWGIYEAYSNPPTSVTVAPGTIVPLSPYFRQRVKITANVPVEQTTQLIPVTVGKLTTIVVHFDY